MTRSTVAGMHTGKSFCARQVTYLAILLVSLLSVGCGGGGQAAVPRTPTPPTASAVQISPGYVSVLPSEVVQFTASVTPSGASQTVAWTITDNGCFDWDCGTIDSTGRYTAPATRPGLNKITVRAKAASNSNITANATINLLPPEDWSYNDRFQGQYAVLLGTAFDSFLEARQALAATIIADGEGGIRGTCDDPGHSELGAFLEGTYSLGQDFRARITLTCGTGPSRTLYAAFVPVASGQQVERGQITQLGYPQEDLSSGMIARQDPSAFSAEAVAGDFAFSLGPLIGRFTADSSGKVIANGQLDLQFGEYSQRNLSFTGTYEMGSNGIGKIVVQGLPHVTIPDPFLPVAIDDLLHEFRIYAISKDELVIAPTFSSTGCCPVDPAVSVGLGLRQTLPLAKASLNGPAVLLHTQADSKYLLSRVGFDGNGAFTGSGYRYPAGFGTGGTLEENVPVAGTYTVAGDGLGRGSITINGEETALYLVKPGKALLGLNSLPALLEAQTGGPYSNSSISGSYALGSSTPPFWTRTTGVLNFDGNGAGEAVLDSFIGSVGGQTSESWIGADVTSGYLVDENGRFGILLSNYSHEWDGLFYLVSPSKAVGLWIHASGVAVMEK